MLGENQERLMHELFDTLLVSEISPSQKVTALIALMQVYCALVGITEDEFKDLAYLTGKSYPGPVPDAYAEWIINFYAHMR